MRSTPYTPVTLLGDEPDFERSTSVPRGSRWLTDYLLGRLSSRERNRLEHRYMTSDGMHDDPVRCPVKRWGRARLLGSWPKAQAAVPSAAARATGSVTLTMKMLQTDWKPHDVTALRRREADRQESPSRSVYEPSTREAVYPATEKILMCLRRRRNRCAREARSKCPAHANIDVFVPDLHVGVRRK